MDQQRIVEIEAAQVPNKLFVACPKMPRFRQVRVTAACVSCECFNHFLEVSNSEAFEDRYRVICLHPISRRMTEVEA